MGQNERRLSTDPEPIPAREEGFYWVKYVGSGNGGDIFVMYYDDKGVWWYGNDDVNFTDLVVCSHRLKCPLKAFL